MAVIVNFQIWKENGTREYRVLSLSLLFGFLSQLITVQYMYMYVNVRVY